MAHLEPDCYASPSTANLIVALVLVIGIICSYFPQYISIVRRKSSDGLDIIMLSIALLSAFFTASNSGILKWPLVTCCKDLSFGECVLNNLATEQLIASLLCVFVLFCLYLKYFRVEPTENESRGARLKLKKIHIAVFLATIFVGLFVSILAGILYYNLNFSSKVLSQYANVLGIMSGICVVFQWGPQIITTWRMQDPGCLSLGMLCLQMPGALLVAFFQGVLNHASWTTWVPYLVGALNQLVLICMIVFFWIRKRIAKKRLSDKPLSELDPLLAEPKPV